MKKYCVYCMSALEDGEEICPFCEKRQDYSSPPHHLAPGTILNKRYYVGKAIGQGGFGITYIGKDITLNIRVAIKEYYPSAYVNRNSTISPEVLVSQSNDRENFYESGKRRFLDEARNLAMFSNEPGIVNVRDYFEENNSVYIVMEYIDGETLKDYLSNKGHISPKQTLQLLLPIMYSLSKMHRQGIIHRDISPDNIMMTRGNQAKLLDFGAARFVSAAASSSLSIVIKPGFAPEEQYRSKGKQGPWTDIYALCATIYTCITGIVPDDAPQRLHCDEVMTPSALGIDIDAEIENAIMKGLSVNQVDRYQSIEELIDGIQGAKGKTNSDYVTVVNPAFNGVEILPTPEDAEEKNVCIDEDATETKSKKVSAVKTNENGNAAKSSQSEQDTTTDSNKHTEAKSTGALESQEKKATEAPKRNVHNKNTIILTSIICILAIGIIITMVFIFGKNNNSVAYPTEKEMRSDSALLLQNNNISGVISDVAISSTNEDKDSGLYSAICTLQIGTDKSASEISVALIYEFDDEEKEWVFSEDSSYICDNETPSIEENETQSGRENYNAIIGLYLDNNMTIADYNIADEMLKERITILFGENNYDLTEEDSSYYVRFNSDLLKDADEDIDLNSLVMCAISRPTELYVFYNEDSTINTVLPRDGIISANALKKSFNEIAPSSVGLGANERISCVELKFDEETAGIINSYIDTYGIDKVRFGMDMDYGYDSWLYFPYLLQGSDAQTFYIIDNWQGGCLGDKYHDVMAYNFSNETLPNGVTFETYIDYPPEWETIETADFVGEHQVNELDGDYVILHFTTYDDEYTNGEFSDTVESFKRRMDIIGNPYKFGYASNDSSEIIIATSPEKIGPDVINLIASGAGSIAIQTSGYKIGWLSKNYEYGDTHYSIIENDDGTYSFEYTINPESYEATELATATRDFTSGGNVYLTVNGSALSSCHIDGAINNGGTLVFSDAAFNSEISITDEYLFIWQLVDAVLNDDKRAIYYSFDTASYSFVSNGETVEEGDVAFGLPRLSAEDVEVRNIVKGISDDITVSISQFETSTIKFFMHLEVNDDLPRVATDLIEEIYTACGFDGGAYSKINFYLIDEQAGERCRLFFSKNYISTDYEQGICIDCYGICTGGRVERYGEEFLEILNASEFYSQKLGIGLMGFET